MDVGSQPALHFATLITGRRPRCNNHRHVISATPQLMPTHLELPHQISELIAQSCKHLT